MNDLIEAIARNVFDLENHTLWDRTTETMRNYYRDSVRKALAAVKVCGCERAESEPHPMNMEHAQDARKEPRYGVKIQVSEDMQEDVWRRTP